MAFKGGNRFLNKRLGHFSLSHQNYRIQIMADATQESFLFTVQHILPLTSVY
jgi:hypothetical protein